MDDVRVHFNSSEPAQPGAVVHARETDTNVGPGQENYLPDEPWHVAPQQQGRVRSTGQINEGVPVNDDAGLERESDAMGARALDDARSIREPVGS